MRTCINYNNYLYDALAGWHMLGLFEITLVWDVGMHTWTVLAS